MPDSKSGADGAAPDVFSIGDIRRLRRVLQREELREKNARKFDAVVRKTDMTEADAAVHGAYKSVLSCRSAFDKALLALERARREVDRTSKELEEVTEIYEERKRTYLSEG